jgi:N-acetylmuramoyl-L-alanine amidase
MSEDMVRIAVTGGQDGAVIGGHSPDGKYIEREWDKKRALLLTDAINAADGMEAKAFGMNGGKGAPSIFRLLGEVNAWRPQVFIDLSSGAAGEVWADNARGATVYCRVGDTDSHRLGLDIGQTLCAATGLRFRGATECNHGSMYGCSVLPRRNRTPLSLQVEWGFYSSHLDLAIMTDAQRNEAGVKAIADQLWQHFNSDPKAVDRPVLRLGDSGDTVKTLQAALRANGFNPGPANGIFGMKTQAAVRSFQRLYLGPNAVDGVVGPRTWAALLP